MKCPKCRKHGLMACSPRYEDEPILAATLFELEEEQFEWICILCGYWDKRLYEKYNYRKISDFPYKVRWGVG